MEIGCFALSLQKGIEPSTCRRFIVLPDEPKVNQGGALAELSHLSCRFSFPSESEDFSKRLRFQFDLLTLPADPLAFSFAHRPGGFGPVNRNDCYRL